jgi:iron complex transport system ATP-binding protein
VQAPRLFLLDEPLAHLDPHHGLAALRLLREQTTTTSAGIAIVMHDANLALRWCDRALLLYGDGECGEGSVDEMLIAENLARLYGHPLRTLDNDGRPWFVPA